MLYVRGDTQIVFPNLSASKYFTLSKASIDSAPEDVYSFSYYYYPLALMSFYLILIKDNSLRKLFFINSLVSGTPLLWKFLIIDSKLSSLMKLYLKPRDLILVPELLNIPSEIA